ncbi:MAG: DUF4890 domain-containing protein [Saprospirales bacterium]|nr:DUF4890 domain-containing protein [Saprospirales bacterium]
MIKTVKTLILFLSGALALQAQPGGGRMMNPEQRAEQQTTLMTEKLALSEAQVNKVQEINLRYANKMKDARDQADGDWEAMRETMGLIRQEQDNELQTVLTQEQWQQWVAYREEMRANRGNYGRGGGPDTAPPPPPAENGEQPAKKKKQKKEKTDSGSDQ